MAYLLVGAGWKEDEKSLSFLLWFPKRRIFLMFLIFPEFRQPGGPPEAAFVPD